MGLCKCHYFSAASSASLHAAAVDGKDVLVNSEQLRHRDDAALMAMIGLGFLADFPTTCQVGSETFCCCKILTAVRNMGYFCPQESLKVS